MDESLQYGRACGSAWVRWVLCLLLTWPAVQAYAGPSNPSGIDGPTIAMGDSHTCAIQQDGRLKCWELTGDGPNTTLEGHFVSVASGKGFSCGLRSDGEAVCLGSYNRVPPTPPPGPWRSLAAGSEEACGLRPDGRLQCWGRSDGIGAIAPLSGRFMALSMTYRKACAIRTDGTLQCWSHDDWDNLTDVPPGRYISVSAMSDHACALRSDSRVFCWGNDYAGPAPGESDFIAVSAGDLHNCALRRDATIACWGIPIYGGLNAPQGRFVQISAGKDSTCAVQFDGKVQCWGPGSPYLLMNEAGVGLAGVEVGGGEVCVLDVDGEPRCIGNVSSMQPAPGRYSRLSLGAASGCGILRNGGAACWGASLGPTPTTAMSEVSVGEAHACGIQTDGAVVCWGDNSFGQSDTPPGDYLTVVAGDRYSCAVSVVGTVSCWGEGPVVSGVAVGGGFRSLHANKSVVCASRESDAQCWGDSGAWLDQVRQIRYPVAAVGDYFVCWQSGQNVTCYGDYLQGVPYFSPGSFVAVAAEGNRACAIDRTGQLICRGGQSFWGVFNRETRIGTGMIATGTAHTCSAGSSGLIDCWGDNAFGQRDAPHIRARTLDVSADHACAVVGTNTLQCWGDDSRSGSLPLPGVTVRSIDIGQYNGCAVRTDGGASCWGWNANGQSTPPADVFRRVATGLNHSCGLRDDNTLTCWGYGADGQILAPAGEFIAVDVGERHSCAIALGGGLRCWGMDSEGQATPPVDSSATYRALSAGSFHNCAIRSDGTLACWGRNNHGQSTSPQGRFASVSAGVAHSCAIRDDGGRICWGSNSSGQSPSLAIGPVDLPRGDQNVPYEARFLATGSAGYVLRSPKFRMVSGALPTGIALGQDGLLSGRTIWMGAYDFVVEVRDANGFVASRQYRLQIGPSSDTTPPVITGGIISGTIGDNGWYTSDVHVRWDASDAESGIVETEGCDESVISADFRSGAVTCSALNRGGRRQVESQPLKRDATPPQIRTWLNPVAPNANGWYTAPVSVFYDCLDVTSGMNGDCPQPAALSLEGVQTFPIQSARDNAGNIATTPATLISIDWTRPQLSATMPPVQLFVGATHDFQLSATDGVSGIASQSCTPIDTSPPSVSDTGSGLRVATCTAIDRAGNSNSVSAVYLVVYPTRRTSGAGQPMPQNQRAPKQVRRGLPQTVRRGVKPAKPSAR